MDEQSKSEPKLPNWLVHSETLDFTPALVVALRGAIELIDVLGYEARLILRGGEEVVYFADPDQSGRVIGCIVFSVDGEGPYKQIWIWLSYVEPDMRRKGVFKQLWFALEQITRAKGISKIVGAVRFSNAPMNAAALSRGRLLDHSVYVKRVTPSVAGENR